MKLCEKDVRGTIVTVEVTDRGYFVVKTALGESIGGANTMDAAIQQANEKLRKAAVRVAVPFKLSDGGAGVATGFHAATGHVLVRINKTTEQWPHGTPNRNHVGRPRAVLDSRTSDEDIQAIIAHRAQAVRSNAVADLLVARNHLDLERAVEVAVQEASAAAT